MKFPPFIQFTHLFRNVHFKEEYKYKNSECNLYRERNDNVNCHSPSLRIITPFVSESKLYDIRTEQVC